MVFIYIAIGIAALLIIAVLLFVFAAFKYAVKREGLKIPDMLNRGDVSTWTEHKAEMESELNWIEAQPMEELSIKSFDGLALRGYFFPAENAKRTLILMHGFRGGPLRDFCFMIRFLHENGCNLLMPYQRAHGKSEGKYLCYGVKERFDCKRWAELIANKNEGLPVYLCGISMGAATVLMASGLELPKCVKGIVADCGFASPREIFIHTFKRNFKIPYFPIVPLFFVMCKMIARFGVRDADTVTALEKNELPVLFAHGGRDNFVPPFMGYESYEACHSDKEMFFVEHARHAGCSAVDPEGYRKKLLELFNKCES